MGLVLMLDPSLPAGPRPHLISIKLEIISFIMETIASHVEQRIAARLKNLQGRIPNDCADDRHVVTLSGLHQ